MTEQPASGRQTSWIALWFAFDAFFFLFPPIYWTSNAYKTSVFGLPSNLLYFAVGCIFITFSVIAAYLYDARDPARRA